MSFGSLKKFGTESNGMDGTGVASCANATEPANAKTSNRERFMQATIPHARSRGADGGWHVAHALLRAVSRLFSTLRLRSEMRRQKCRRGTRERVRHESATCGPTADSWS